MNVRTFRPEMMISSPVCGLRPFRGRFSWTTKLPKPEIFDLLALLELRLDDLEERFDDFGRLLLREPDPLVDALHDVGFRHGHRRGPQLRSSSAKRARRWSRRRAWSGVHLVVGERAVRGTVRDGVGQALLAGGDRRTAVAVEEPRRLDPRIAEGPHLFEDGIGQEAVVHDHRDVPRHGGISRQRPGRRRGADHRETGSRSQALRARLPQQDRTPGRFPDGAPPATPTAAPAARDDGRLPRVQEGHVGRGLPAHGGLVAAETDQQIADDALQVEEVDRRAVALHAARRPAARTGGCRRRGARAAGRRRRARSPCRARRRRRRSRRGRRLPRAAREEPGERRAAQLARSPRRAGS